MPVLPSAPTSEAVENDSEPKTLPSQELPKAIVLKNPVGNLKTEPPTEDTPLWKSFGLLVVFITGLAMIFYYLRKYLVNIGLFFREKRLLGFKAYFYPL